MEAQVQSQANPCGIFDGQNSIGTVFSPGTSVFLVIVISPIFHA
jgi:hypothetical protein